MIARVLPFHYFNWTFRLGHSATYTQVLPLSLYQEILEEFDLKYGNVKLSLKPYRKGFAVRIA